MTYEVQIHRDIGHDESFDADTWDDVERIVRDESGDDDTRLIVVIDEYGSVAQEWHR